MARSRGTLHRALLALLLLASAGRVWAVPHHHRDPYANSAAAYAAVLDGELLWGRNLDAPRAPASLTKLLTALVLLDANWQPDALLPVSHEAAHTMRQRAGFRTGDEVRAEDALTAMLVHSANDACLVLVEHAAASLEEFAARMNQRAQQLGMTESHFVHPCGYDAEGQYSTVNDLLRLARAAHADPRIAHIVAEEHASFTTVGGRTLSFNNTNQLLGRLGGVVGLKTGYTAQAGHCLIAVAEQAGHRVWLVLLDSHRRWSTAHRMIDAAFATAGRLVPVGGAGAVSTHASIAGL
jgi:D-alanyl-D-alanine carboxypeptidase (penicillin-binding protein 5/6)